MTIVLPSPAGVLSPQMISLFAFPSILAHMGQLSMSSGDEGYSWEKRGCFVKMRDFLREENIGKPLDTVLLSYQELYQTWSHLGIKDVMYHLNRKVEFCRRYQHLNFIDKKIKAQGGDVTTYSLHTSDRADIRTRLPSRPQLKAKDKKISPLLGGV